jgi:TRAP-type C4-dicarboxylate transport system substrate-binding protein
MKRELLVALFVLLVVLGASACPVAAAETTLKAYSPFQKESKTAKRVSEIYREIERAAGGSVKIQESWIGQVGLGQPSDVLGALATGTVDVVVGPGSEYRDKVAIGKLGFMPFNFRRPADRSNIFYHTDVGDLMDSAFRKTTGVRVVGSFNYLLGQELLVRRGKTVRRLDDMKGMKVRAGTPETFELLKRLGANPVSTAIGEIHTSLQQGTLDGAVLPISMVVEGLNLRNVVGQAVGPDFVFAGLRMDLVQFNGKAWDRLGTAVQAQIQEAIRRVAVEDDGKVAREMASYREEATKAGVSLVTLPEEDIKRASEIARSAVADFVANSKEQGLLDEAQKITRILLAQIEGPENIVEPFDGDVKYEKRADRIVFRFQLRERADVTITVMLHSNGEIKEVARDTKKTRPKGENEWVWKPASGSKGVYRLTFQAKNVYRSGDHYRRLVITLP